MMILAAIYVCKSYHSWPGSDLGNIKKDYPLL